MVGLLEGDIVDVVDINGNGQNRHIFYENALVLHMNLDIVLAGKARCTHRVLNGGQPVLKFRGNEWSLRFELVNEGAVQLQVFQIQAECLDTLLISRDASFILLFD